MTGDPGQVFRTGTLMGLPLTEWAARLRSANVCLHGRVAEQSFALGGRTLVIAAGPIRVEVELSGGASPCMRRARIDADLSVRGDQVTAGASLVLERGVMTLDGVALPVLGDRMGGGRMLAALVRQLADVRAVATAEPDGDVVVHLGGGIQVRLAAGVDLTLRAATLGPPDALQLCAPLELGFGGDGMRLAHDGLRFLSRLASVRIERATLHPDGSVDLEGAGRRGLDPAVQGGLHTASAGLSTLLRRSPRFRRVRDLLTRER